MSRIGKAPIPVPAGVKVNITGQSVKVEGPKGKLELTHHPLVTVKVDGSNVVVTRPNDERESRALHGLTRALINNMVVGVTKGYEKKLKIEGVGYQAVAKDGKNAAGAAVKGVELMVGFANRPTFMPPEGVTCQVVDPTTILVSGSDKQKVGQFAAEIRAAKKPEPYKGKGVRYENEVVRRKEGKSFSGK
ncbi:MAG: 50S ribosomal protein L6 [Fimbriiglobus sp.]|jgi:large subunit ribosomal protein L6|nr:50S ribosomal protein L6 [Fimbriiglobus sp.]